MQPIMWYLTRSTGIVGTVLAMAALVWGFLFSARATGTKLRPNWWLDLHNWLGGLALVFIGLHILASWLDSNSVVGVVQVFVPGTATGMEWPIGWGVIATYLFAVAVFTTWPKRLGNRRLWRVAHLGSVVGMVLGLLHAYQSGSDATSNAFRGGLIVLAAIGTYAMGLRLFGQVEKSISKQKGA